MYAVVRTDKMFGTDNRAGIVSVRYVIAGEEDEVVPAAIENGCVLLVPGMLDEGSREVYLGVDPTAEDDLSRIVLVASPEVMYDDRKKNLDEFINEAGKIARGYYLHPNDIFSVTKEAFGNLDADELPEVGMTVELADDIHMYAVDSLTPGSTQIGKIIDKNVVGRHTYYAIQVM